MRILRPFVRNTIYRIIGWEADAIFPDAPTKLLSRFGMTRSPHYNAILSATLCTHVNAFFYIFDKLYPSEQPKASNGFMALSGAKKTLAKIKEDCIIRDCFDHAIQYDNVTMARVMYSLVPNICHHFEDTASYGSVKCLKLIIRRDSHKISDYFISNANIYAARGMRLPIIKILNRCGMLHPQLVFDEVSFVARYDLTHLSEARKIISYLIADRTDIDISSAINLCDYPITKILLPMIKQYEHFLCHAIYQSARNGKISALRLLLRIPGSSTYIQKAINEAAKSNKVKTMKFLRSRCGV